MKRITSIYLLLLTALLATTQTPSLATERFDLRTTPGNGGSDMTAPLEPGLYIQMPTYAYEGKATMPASLKVMSSQSMFTGSLAGLSSAFPMASATTPVESTIRVHVQALAPRLTYMSNTRFMGATVGGMVMLRLVAKQAEMSNQVGTTSLQGIDNTTLGVVTSGSLTNSMLASGINDRVRSMSLSASQQQTGQSWGMGDMELAPILRWFSDPDQFLLIPSFVLPTGNYDSTISTSSGSGDFYTLRPAFQYGHIGDGWDFGTRVSMSFNSRNTETGYRSGNYLNADLAAMLSLNDALRIGVNGYAVVQTTHDTSNQDVYGVSALTVGRKGRVFGVGPSLAWIKGAEDMLLELRVTKEFGAQYRPEGTAMWINVSVPLQ